jgi:hypothetical protein
MTISIPKLILLIVVVLAVWYVSRVVNRGVSVLERRRPKAATRPGGIGAVEDLVSCRICGAYISPGARACGRPACPQPR